MYSSKPSVSHVHAKYDVIENLLSLLTVSVLSVSNPCLSALPLSSVSLCLCLFVSESVLVSVVYLLVFSLLLSCYKNIPQEIQAGLSTNMKEKSFFFSFFFTHDGECTVNLWLTFFSYFFSMSRKKSKKKNSRTVFCHTFMSKIKTY